MKHDETSNSVVATVNKDEPENSGVGTNEDEYTVDISAMEVPRGLNDNQGAYWHHGTITTDNEQYVLGAIESNTKLILRLMP